MLNYLRATLPHKRVLRFVYLLFRICIVDMHDSDNRSISQDDCHVVVSDTTVPTHMQYAGVENLAQPLTLGFFSSN